MNKKSYLSAAASQFQGASHWLIGCMNWLIMIQQNKNDNVKNNNKQSQRTKNADQRERAEAEV